jgi:hypothetical protein
LLTLAVVFYHIVDYIFIYHDLKIFLYRNVQYWRTETLCTSEGQNKSVCQARLNTSQPLLPVEICTRSWTPDAGLMDVSD